LKHSILHELLHGLKSHSTSPLVVSFPAKVDSGCVWIPAQKDVNTHNRSYRQQKYIDPETVYRLLPITPVIASVLITPVLRLSASVSRSPAVTGSPLRLRGASMKLSLSGHLGCWAYHPRVIAHVSIEAR
jgi:hypothetical protein